MCVIWLKTHYSFRRSVVVGAGYIAVEIAGILSALGSKTSLLIRYGEVRHTHFFFLLTALLYIGQCNKKQGWGSVVHAFNSLH